ncbi:uncharacterized protein L969DRAFT_84821 [Mixia osmundae IAM 14324]|uniref:C4-dicarboxylate transporter/malic acid transport protein n=1 Tax=Mixia osmundae (strain CBS 9802 / IAM 14324 / JCM 22182 / KY 12970) TaxID=764103 RepID=G7DT82_MIXOS|nr:uncharacterized protein L969DRAFT_84821 [Mixia osmundae IAM 14324]KEI42933.1 hypothetical protein L969DRAFT_84821 [Mixia osmundae IAM 14324]GAA93729.1 hypothetical protein E5Q_00375 [Mixia osmundae IAM 14324]
MPSDVRPERRYYAGLSEDLPPSHWQKRVRSITWAYYTIVMGTGALAFLLYEIPWRFQGLIVLGDIVFVINLIFFVVITAGLILRFALFPGAFKNSMLHPFESSFVPCLPLAMANIIAEMQDYGTRHTGFWLIKTGEVLFWVYLSVALTICFIIPPLQYTVQRHPFSQFSPLWMMPALCVVFSGALASTVSTDLPPYSSVSVLTTSFITMGLGLIVAILYTAGFITRLLVHGQVPAAQIPTLFITVGPFAWTAYGLLAVGTRIETVYPMLQPPPFAMSAMSGPVISLAALLLAMLLYGFSWWVVMTSLVQFVYSAFKGDLPISIAAWSTTFPLAGHINATFQLGQRLDSRFIKNTGIVLFFLWLVFYFWALVSTVFGIWQGKMLVEGAEHNAPTPTFDGDYLAERESKQEA